MDGQNTSYESAEVPQESPSLDPGALLGLLSLLGGNDSRESAGEAPPRDEDCAAELLGSLRPYLRDTRVLSVDRAIRLLETSRGLRGILRGVGPVLGDFLGGKG